MPFVAGTFIVALLFQANSYIAIAKTLNLDNVPVLARVQWLLYTLPYQLKFTFPTGIALAAALSVGRMARESEITAIRAAGAPVLRVLRPVLLFGLLAGALNYAIVDRVIPVCGQKARDLQNKNVLLSMTSTRRFFKANAFIQLDKYGASLGTVHRTADDDLVIENVMLIERNGPHVTEIVTAPTGIYQGGLWTFRNAQTYHVDGMDIWPISTKELVIDWSVDLNGLFAANSADMGGGQEEMRTEELLTAIAAAKREHTDPREYEKELYSRSAAGVACAVFAFTSAVFAVAFSRSGGFAGLLVSFSVCVLYYNAYVISMEILGKNESVPSWLAAWLPNIVFLALGLVWVRRIE